MITYEAHYYRTGSYGYYYEMAAIVTANTKSEALGLLLAEFPVTVSDYWTLTEYNTSVPSVSLIMERES